MKKFLRITFLPLALVFMMASCSSDSTDELVSNSNMVVVNSYSYSTDELQLEQLINNYRVSVGLNSLESVAHVSFKSEEHNEYMIAKNQLNHDFFQERSQNIIQVLGATKVNENVAYNYITPEGALHAWLQSPGHKANIEGDFTHFGVSIRVDPNSGKKYYTNIFVKR